MAMDVGEVRVAEDKDFEVLKIYLSRNDGWRLEYERADTRVWTRSPANIDGSDFKMIRVRKKVSPSLRENSLSRCESKKLENGFLPPRLKGAVIIIIMTKSHEGIE